MRFLHLFLGCAAGALLAACATPAAEDVRERMVGLSEGQLAICMGEPVHKEDRGTTETWVYYRPDGTNSMPLDASLMPRSRPVADMGSNACVVTIKLEDEKVMAVDYVNMASTREDEECSRAVQRCAR